MTDSIVGAMTEASSLAAGATGSAGRARPRAAMEAAAVPSLRAFTLLFVLLSWCAGVIAVTQSIYVPAACAFIVPESAAQWASTIAGLAIASALVGPIFGTIADEMGDILPALIGAITISTAGAVLAIVGCHMINISLFAIGAFLMAAGGLGGVFPLLFAMCGMFGFIVPDRTGSISSAMLLAMTLVQTVSALICALMPLEESHLTYLYFILAGDIVSMVGTAGLACTPLRSLFAPLGDRPNSDGPKVSAISYCTSALRSILIDWTSAAYAPLRLALLAGARAQSFHNAHTHLHADLCPYFRSWGLHTPRVPNDHWPCVSIMIIMAPHKRIAAPRQVPSRWQR
jgi:hypothetical protein